MGETKIPTSTELTSEQAERLLRLLKMTDHEFYEEFMSDWTMEELIRFAKLTPNFSLLGEEFYK